MTRNYSTYSFTLAGSLRDMTSFYNNLLSIAISGPDNYELLSYQYIVCASQVFQLVYQINKLQFRVPKLLDHCTF